MSRLAPEGPRDAKAMASRSAVGQVFIEAASAAMETSDLLDGSSPTTTDALRDAIAFTLAYQAALTEGKAFVRAMAHTLRAAKATAGERALDIYALAQRLVKKGNGAELVPHVETCRASSRAEGDFGTRSRPFRNDGAEAHSLAVM